MGKQISYGASETKYMHILAIETSCDETAVSLIEAKGTTKNLKFKVLANSLFSQAKLHEEYGGVFPNLARREHQKNLIPLFLRVLKKSGANFSDSKKLKAKSEQPRPNDWHRSVGRVKALLVREPELLEQFEKHIVNLSKPKIDRIAVTVGPGLEPALWVGISFAKALSALWDIPLIPVNHMKGHFLAPLAEGKNIEFPALGLLISGGHTELVLAKSPISYKIVGKTLDDAAGEAYDKAARILGLPYPGGPQIARLAEARRAELRIRNYELQNSKLTNLPTYQLTNYSLPRPMIHSKDLNFSFSGLKTAVLYMVQKIRNSRPNDGSVGQAQFVIPNSTAIAIAGEFEESVKDVLVHKTKKALEAYKVKTLIVGGGVSANTYIKKHLEKLAKSVDIKFLASSKSLATDNAVMIGIAGFFAKPKPLSKIKALGNLEI